MNFPRLRAPAEQLGFLAVPPLTDAANLFQANQFLLSESQRQSRREAITLATAYLQELGEPVPPIPSDAPIILTGHQPDLVHPGVWAKNFIVHRLARALGGVGLHVLTDNDLVKQTAVRVPAGDHLAQVPLDHWQGAMPFEELDAANVDFLADFPRRLQAFAKDWPFQPLAATCWRPVVSSRAARLGERLAAGRRALERSWGCHNLEVPLSRLCGSESFARFTLALLARAKDFHLIHNVTRRDIRREWRVKNFAHPVPTLVREGDWLEAPFWAWRSGERQRRHLLVLPLAAGFQLRAGTESMGRMQGSMEVLLARWKDLQQQGWKIRPRALTTTWFLRVWIGALFVHGLGGGRYDEMTDRLMARFQGITPPQYMTCTATVRLPFPGFAKAAEESRRLQRLERDLTYNPDRHLDAASAVKALTLVDLKRVWQASATDHAIQRRDRYEQIRRLNAALGPFVAEQLQTVRELRRRAEAEARSHEVLGRRDYAFCLHPEEPLRTFVENLA